MTARDAETWGTTAGVRRGEMAALERQADQFPRCGSCKPGCPWHGLRCRHCGCETSFIDKGDAA